MTNKNIILIALVASFGTHLQGAGTAAALIENFSGAKDYVTGFLSPRKTQTVETFNQPAQIVLTLPATEREAVFAMQDREAEMLSAMPEEKTWSEMAGEFVKEMAYDAGCFTLNAAGCLAQDISDYSRSGIKSIAKKSWHAYSDFAKDLKFINACGPFALGIVLCPVCTVSLGASIVLAGHYPNLFDF